MMSFASIRAMTDKLTCKGGESIECAFDVINATDATLRVGVEPMGELKAKKWVELTGPVELELPARGQEKVKAKVSLPAEAAPTGAEAAKSYSFKLRVYDVRDTERAVESIAVAVEVPRAEEPVPPPEPKAENGPNWGLIIGGIVGGVVLLAGIGVVLWLALSGGGEKVPDVVNLSLDEAVAELKDARLWAAISEEVTGEAEPGTVIRQDPAPGEDIPPDNTVAIVMELASVQVPNLVGLTVPAAEAQLVAAGLEVGNKSYERGGLHPGGAVLGQDPAAGERALQGFPVDLRIEMEMVAVPKLTGLKYSEAGQMLNSIGLVAGDKKNGRGEGEPGTVIDQNPPSGAELERGKPVSLTLKEQTLEVPRVVGETLHNATVKVTGANLKLEKVSYAYIDARQQPDTVKSQTPDPGAEAYAGDDVTLVVWAERPKYTTQLFGAVQLSTMQVERINTKGLTKERGTLRHVPPEDSE